MKRKVLVVFFLLIYGRIFCDISQNIIAFGKTEKIDILIRDIKGIIDIFVPGYFNQIVRNIFPGDPELKYIDRSKSIYFYIFAPESGKKNFLVVIPVKDGFKLSFLPEFKGVEYKLKDNVLLIGDKTLLDRNFNFNFSPCKQSLKIKVFVPTLFKLYKKEIENFTNQLSKFQNLHLHSKAAQPMQIYLKILPVLFKKLESFLVQLKEVEITFDLKKGIELEYKFLPFPKTTLEKIIEKQKEQKLNPSHLVVIKSSPFISIATSYWNTLYPYLHIFSPLFTRKEIEILREYSSILKNVEETSSHTIFKYPFSVNISYIYLRNFSKVKKDIDDFLKIIVNKENFQMLKDSFFIREIQLVPTLPSLEKYDIRRLIIKRQEIKNISANRKLPQSFTVDIIFKNRMAIIINSASSLTVDMIKGIVDNTSKAGSKDVNSFLGGFPPHSFSCTQIDIGKIIGEFTKNTSFNTSKGVGNFLPIISLLHNMGIKNIKLRASCRIEGNGWIVNFSIPKDTLDSIKAFFQMFRSFSTSPN